MIIERILCAIFAAACIQGASPKPSEAKLTPVAESRADRVCFADAYGVWRHSPGSWAGWTRQMAGHVGDKCYYPTRKHERKVVHSIRTNSKTTDSRPRPTVVPAGAALDHAAKTRLFMEFERWKRDRQIDQLF